MWKVNEQSKGPLAMVIQLTHISIKKEMQEILSRQDDIRWLEIKRKIKLDLGFEHG